MTNQPPSEPTLPFDPHDLSNNTGQSRRIGPYKLLQKIGEGGMGEVWMADQQQPVRRRVALKLIKSGLDNRQILARFEAERQALAIMNHQNIAQVFDAGTSDDGTPYFVMELVQGVPLTTYCDQNSLSIDERLKLFIPVCQAVQHAHLKGIIHRDLKPTNVLVSLYDGQPVPKVIDFGLAKALQHQMRLTDKTLFTEFGQVVGTVQYMSPEQAELNQLDIDTRTDIYSLGIMLYELLAGSTPIDTDTIRRQAILQILETIRSQDPPRPSARLSSLSKEAASGISQQRKTEVSQLRSVLSVDLDWIVMKALEKERGRRYESASGFADDIQRYLSGQPVTARPPSIRYRVKKYLRRRKSQVAWSFALFILLATLLVSGWMTLERIRQTREIGRLDQALQHEKVAAENERRAKEEALLNEERAVIASHQAADARHNEMLARLEAQAARDEISKNRAEAERQAEMAQSVQREMRKQLTTAENRLERALAALKAAGIEYEEDSGDSAKRPADE